LNGLLFDGGGFELVVTVQQEVRQAPMAIIIGWYGMSHRVSLA